MAGLFSGTYRLKTDPKNKIKLIDNGKGKLKGAWTVKTKDGRLSIPVKGTYLQSGQSAQGDWVVTISGTGMTKRKKLVVAVSLSGYIDNRPQRIFASVAKAETIDTGGGKQESAKEHQIYDR